MTGRTPIRKAVHGIRLLGDSLLADGQGTLLFRGQGAKEVD